MPTGFYDRSKSKPRPFVEPTIRFWSKVQKGETENDCWKWLGSTKKKYGQFYITHSDWISAHRFSWTLHFGEIPHGMYICHSCDNPPCVNPKHLWVGTQKENIGDMIKKGRAKK